MQELTDAMIAADLGSLSMAILFFPLIVLILILIIFFRLYFTKRKRSYLLVAFISLFLIIADISLLPSFYESGKQSDFYLTYKEVASLEEKVDHSGPGTSKISYYAHVDNERILIGKDVYDSLKQGDTVYAVILHDEVKAIYPVTTYHYVGDKLLP